MNFSSAQKKDEFRVATWIWRNSAARALLRFQLIHKIQIQSYLFLLLLAYRVKSFSLALEISPFWLNLPCSVLHPLKKVQKQSE